MKKKIGEIKGVELNAKQMRELKGGAMRCGGRCYNSEGQHGTCKHYGMDPDCTCSVSGAYC